MKQNIGNIERVVRIVVGAALVVLAVLGTIGWWGWLGLVPAVRVARHQHLQDRAGLRPAPQHRHPPSGLHRARARGPARCGIIGVLQGASP
jgi:hypothetical protein